MPWQTLSEAQMLSEGGFSASERTTLASVAGSDGAVLASTLATAIAEARGVIDAAGNTLGAADTIPDSLRPHIIAIARWRLLTSLPQLKMLQTDARKAASEKGEELLALVAKGERPVENETSDDDDAPRGGDWGSETKINMRSTL